MALKLISTINGQSEVIDAGDPALFTPRAGDAGHEGGSSTKPMMLDVPHQGRMYRVCVRRLPEGDREIWIGHHRVVVNIQDEREAKVGKFVRTAGGQASALRVKAPMPGLIKEITVKEGETVIKGQRLLTLEAMKMENEIMAPGDGVIGKIDLKTGVSVEKDQLLLQLIKHEH